MPKHELLNNIDHKNIKVITERSVKYGDNIWYTPTFWREFRSVQTSYPILFQKESGKESFVPLAIFGIQKGENLFLTDEGWDAQYIPLSVQRMPFYIGFQQAKDSEDLKRVITIDLESPRVSESEGRELFLEFGGNSDYLEAIANILETLHQGLEENNKFISSCLLYTSPSPRDRSLSRMPSSA